MLEIRLFAGFDVQLDGRPVMIPSRSAQTLLAYLLLNRQTAHRREKLAGLIWPDNPEHIARRRLRQALWYIRKAIDGPAPVRTDYILTDDIWVAFNEQADYRLDVDILESALSTDCTTEDLLRMVLAYRGDLLPGFYEDWVLLERERLNGQFDRAIQVLLNRLITDKRWTDVIFWGERWIATGRAPEPAYRALMIAHSSLGDLAAMAAVFQRCRSVLANEWGVEPSATTLDLYDTLRQGGIVVGAPAKQADARHPRATATVVDETSGRHNLPQARTTFIGRTRERAEVRRLLGSCRLLTLTGSGGAGKTRLAMLAAADSLDDFPDGVWLVELASLADPGLVPQTVASVFGLHALDNARLMEVLTHHLCGKHLLLLLDNCEHLLGACAELAEALLSDCPQVVILATSREVLNVAGEIALRVPSLALPDPARLPALDLLMQIESIRLFAERAASANLDFRFTAEIAPAVAEICCRLDGMPLAIELAAARVRTLGIAQIAQRLDDRFQLLIGGSRTARPRQQTLRATVDWSHDLLAETERVLFRRLSVFAGGWSLEAAEAVCADDQEPTSPSWTGMGSRCVNQSDVLDLLSRLVEKSLVVMEDDGGTARYRYLETIRQYANEKLLASGESEGRQMKHLWYFAALGAKAREEMFGATPQIGLRRAGADHDNLRAALAWALRQGLAQTAVALAADLWWFWNVRGYLTEGAEWLRAALEVGDRASPDTRTRALRAAAVLAERTGNIDRAEMLARQCLALCQALGDQAGIAFSLATLGNVARDQEDYRKAQELHDQGLAIYRELGPEQLVCHTLSSLGIDTLCLGDTERAALLCEESVVVGRKLGRPWHLANALAKRGIVALAERDYALARSVLVESLTLQQELQDMWTIACCLDGLASVKITEGQAEDAVRIWGAAKAIGDAANIPLPAAYGAIYAPYVVRARRQLGEAHFEQLWQEGRALTWEQALAEGGRLTIQGHLAILRASDATQFAADMTAREVTVLRLLAQGLSNQQIADQLVLSKRTVHAHLRSIYAKLDVPTRSAAARRAIDLQLL